MHQPVKLQFLSLGIMERSNRVQIQLSNRQLDLPKGDYQQTLSIDTNDRGEIARNAVFEDCMTAVNATCVLCIALSHVRL